MKDIIIEILNTNDLSGFTTLIKGDCLYRYIVSYTHNVIFDIDKLSSQIENSPYQDNITIGGWKDFETELLYIDIGYSTDSITDAIIIGQRHKQIAIRDNHKMEEIRL